MSDVFMSDFFRLEILIIGNCPCEVSEISVQQIRYPKKIFRMGSRQVFSG